MNLDQAKRTFIIEAGELLEAMEAAVLALEEQGEGAQGEARDEAVNAMFRAVHTIKGSAGLFGLDAIVAFAHSVESVLDRVRGHGLELTGELLGLMLACHDHLAGLIRDLGTDAPASDQARAEGDQLLLRLAPYLGGALTRREVRMEAAHAPLAAAPPEQPGRDCWHLSIRFGPDALRNGMDPLSFVRYLATLGEIVHLASLFGRLPEREAFDPETCHLGL
jgi:two-component system chemotaxis sensor kinase CheA